MTRWRIILRSLVYYRAMHAVVGITCVVAAMALCGALLVGDSVHVSLQELARHRVGRIGSALLAEHPMAADLAGRLAGATDSSDAVAPAWLLRGSVTDGDETTRANDVQVLGVDDRFFQLADAPLDIAAPAPGEVYLNQPLARTLGARVGDDVLLLLPRPSLLPRDAPLATQSQAVRILRATVTRIVTDRQWGRFSLATTHAAPATAILNRNDLAQQLDLPDQVNAIFSTASAGAMTRATRDVWTPADAQLRVTETQLTTDRVFLPDRLVNALTGAGGMTYLVNTLAAGDKTTPYSMVSALQPGDAFAEIIPADLAEDEIVLNDWTAADLDAAPGSRVTLTYFVLDGNQLKEASRTFRVRSITPLTGPAGDASLMPRYPGLTDQTSCNRWDTSLPIDLARIRDTDEAYWADHRGTPKAFITLAAGQAMWANRFGRHTLLRSPTLVEQLKQLDPEDAGLVWIDVAGRAESSAHSATDFRALFVGLSVLLIASAMLLMTMTFALGVASRTKQSGLLRAAGFTASQIGWLLLAEGVIVAAAGTIAGGALAVTYTDALLNMLAGPWSGAVAAFPIQLHVRPVILLTGGAACLVVCSLAMKLSLRRILKRPTRALLSESFRQGRGRKVACITLAATGTFLVLLVNGFRIPLSSDLTPTAGPAGGFTHIVTTALPVLEDLSTRAGRSAWGLTGEALDIDVLPLRLREGDDASCLSLARPQEPQLLGVDPAALAAIAPDAFSLDANLFAPDSAVADAPTLKWALQKSRGDTLSIGGVPLELAGSFPSSILQGSVLISQREFERRFPAIEGHRMFLLRLDGATAGEVCRQLTARGADLGLAIETTRARWQRLASVQNTYLDIFTILGGLAMGMGVMGFALVVLRNVLERRRELAMRRAVGFTRASIRQMLVREHLKWLLWGVGMGTAAAMATILLVSNNSLTAGGVYALLIGLAAVIAVGVASINLAAHLAMRKSLLSALRE